MRIAYFLDSSSRGIGGAASLLIKQAKLMSALHEVTIVIPCDERGVSNEECIKRCARLKLKYDIIRFSTSYNFLDVDYIDALNSSRNIEIFAINNGIDFFHTAQLNIAVEMVSRKLGIPHLMNIYQLKKDEFKIKYGDLYPQYHLCDSKLYSNLWSNELGIESRCIRPIAPLDSIIVKNRPILDRIKVLMLGSVCKRKAQLNAIKAIDKSKYRDNIDLIIAGEYDERYYDECNSFVLNNELGNNIRFAGFVSDISDLLVEADCLLCTSIDESFPSSIVEAVTYGLAIITTPVAGVPEVFMNGYNAFVSKDFSIDSIAQSLDECIDYYMDGKINCVFHNAECTWKKYFSPIKVRKQISDYYDYIVCNFKPKKCVTDEFNSEVMLMYRILCDCKNLNIYKRKCLYYSMLKNKLLQGKIYIWGAGQYGKIAKYMTEYIFPQLEVIGYVDKVRMGEYNGCQIVTPDNIDYSIADYIFISFSYGREEVIDYLAQRKFMLNEKVWIFP